MSALRLRFYFLVVLIAVFLNAPSRGATPGEAGIEPDSAGRPALRVDGKPEPLVAGLWRQRGTSPSPALQAFEKAGLKQLVVYANLGMYPPELGYVAPVAHMRPFWRGAGVYDPSDVDKVLAQALEADPDARILLWLGIGEYPDFAANHTDEAIRNEKGEAMIVTGHFERFDDNPPHAVREHYGISFFSEPYRKECGDMLAEFVKTIEASPHGKNVIGYILGGGHDNQLYGWGPPDGSLENAPENWGDYSPPARKAFIRWLEDRYDGKVAELNRAWNVEWESFDQATPPPAADLAGGSAFHDPLKERRAYDWKRFLAEGRADLIDHLAGALKAASSKPVVVGTAGGGDGGHRRDNTSISRLLRSKNLDILVHQPGYGVRIPPSAGGINAMLDSYALNGKLFLTDMDHRLWTGVKKADRKLGVINVKEANVGRAADMAMQRDMWRREFARLWVSGNNGAWFSNHGAEEEYDNAEIQEEMRFLNDFSAGLVAQRCAPPTERGDGPATLPGPAAPAEVVFILDEEAVDFARSALSEFHAAGMFRQWAESHASGVPIRNYYAQDLREGKIPPAKMVVLQNLIDIDPVMAQRIKALREGGTTLVLLQGTGMANLARGQQDQLDDTLGIRLRPLPAGSDPAEPARSAEVDAAHPLLAGDSWSAPATALDAARLKEVGGIALTVDDPRAAVLGLYPKSRLPAAAVIAKPGSEKVIFIGAYNLSRETISRLAGYAGAWRVAPADNVIAADEEILMVHPLKAGKVEVTLKRAAALEELPPGNLTSPKALTHTLDLDAGRTYLFKQIP